MTVHYFKTTLVTALQHCTTTTAERLPQRSFWDCFVTVQVMPKPNARDDTKVDVDVMVKERPMKTADVDMSWGLAPNQNGIPLPEHPVPGGTLTFENRNVGKKGNQFAASVTSENFLVPNDDIGFKVTPRQTAAPYWLVHRTCGICCSDTCFSNSRSSLEYVLRAQ